MKGREDDFSAVIRRLHEASAGACPWPEALEAVAALVGGAGSTIFSLDRQTGAFGDFFIHGLEPGADEYVSRMNRINPRMRFSLAQPGPHVTCDYAVLPETAIRRHEFYDWMERMNGTRYFVGARLSDEEGRSVFTSIDFTAAHGHPEEAHIALFRRLLPHLEDAWQLTQMLSRIEAKTAAAALVQEATPWGILTIDLTGRIIGMNAKAEALLAARDGLRLDDRQLRADRGADHRKLTHLLGEKLAAQAGNDICQRSLISLARPSGRLPLLLRILPLPQVSPRAAPSTPAVIVFISEPDSCPGPSPADLEQLFGLSKKQAALAALLAEGPALPDAARRLGISHNTARAHLREIFARTGARSQVQLVRLLSRLP
jgi:DNA-binding CsgD family transcriptional regulator/PAS domain-containing protein